MACANHRGDPISLQCIGMRSMIRHGERSDRSANVMREQGQTRGINPSGEGESDFDIGFHVRFHRVLQCDLEFVHSLLNLHIVVTGKTDREIRLRFPDVYFVVAEHRHYVTRSE